MPVDVFTYWSLQHAGGMLERSRLRRSLHQWLARNTVIEDVSDFRFSSVALTPEDVPVDCQFELSGLAGIFEDLVEGLLGRQERWATGAGDHLPLGPEWSGRPSIHIVEFEGQPEQASHVLRRYKEPLSRILFRTNESIDQQLPRNLRALDDYLWFITKPVTLTVCARKALANRAHSDPNWGDVIYDKQVLAELVEFIYMSHRRVEVLSERSEAMLEELFDQRRSLMELTKYMEEASPSGEITDALRMMDDAFGLAAVRRRSRDNVSAMASILLARRAKRETALARIVSIVLGLISVQSLSNSVIGPAWRLLGWPLPGTSEGKELVFAGAASVVVVILVGTAWWALGSRSRSKRELSQSYDGRRVSLLLRPERRDAE